MTREQDLEPPTRLNADYLASDQNSDVARDEEFLAPEFTASLPDLNIYDRAAFPGIIAKPQSFRSWNGTTCRSPCWATWR